MKRRLVLTIVLAGCGLALLLAGLSGQAADAQGPCDRYVLAIDGSDAGNCGDEAHPCRTVQYAVQRAATGDRICVADHSLAPGPTVYHGTVSITRSVTLDGAWQAACAGVHPLVCDFTAVPCNPANVVLDGQMNGRVISISGSIAPTIQCFTITGGDAAGQGGDPGGSVQNDAGGGIYSRNAAPIIRNNVISGNFGCDVCPAAYGRGGGIYLINASAGALISGNLVINNVADNSTWGEGGGIMLRNSNAQVRFNTIRNNRALWGSGDPGLISRGGGIYYDTGDAGVAPLIRDNTVRDNLAAMDAEAYGGGMYLHGLAAGARVSGNAVHGNIAGFNQNGSGGGLYLDDCRGALTDNRIESNQATPGGSVGRGGGLFINQGAPLVRSNVISGNAGAVVAGIGLGGGLFASQSDARIQDNVIYANVGTSSPTNMGVGGGFYGVLGHPALVHNRITDNHAGYGPSGWGGGIYLESAQPWLEGNTLLDNGAAAGAFGYGGGTWLMACPVFTFTNNIVARNHASARGSGVLLSNSAGTVAFNTIAENQGGEQSGVHVEAPLGTIALTNNIILGHVVGIIHGNPAADQVRARCTLFEGNALNYSAGVASSQEVAGPAALTPDYRLSASSGAIDHACPLAWVTTDIDGHPRPIGTASDVGAAEWYAALLNLPVVMRDVP